MKVLFSPGSVLAVMAVAFSVVSQTVLAEEEPTLSPAEVALQQQQQTAQAERFKKLCERIILEGVEPKRSEFIASLNNQTCDEAAQSVLNASVTSE